MYNEERDTFLDFDNHQWTVKVTNQGKRNRVEANNSREFHQAVAFMSVCMCAYTYVLKLTLCVCVRVIQNIGNLSRSVYPGIYFLKLVDHKRMKL